MVYDVISITTVYNYKPLVLSVIKVSIRKEDSEKEIRLV